MNSLTAQVVSRALKSDSKSEPAQRIAPFIHHRPLLFSIAYRMLGSVADAEDMLQETFIRWQQSSETEITSPRAFLVTILTRLCLTHLDSARTRREQYCGQWLPEPLISEAYDPISEQIEKPESLSMAFLVLLERLLPLERAGFLLREVFDYDYAEVASILKQTESNCRQLLRRARQHLAGQRPRFDASREERERLLREFMQATAGGDLHRLETLLSEDAILYSDGGGKGPALPVQILGRQKVARALLGASRKLVPRNLATELKLVNGELGAVSYLGGRPYSAFTMDLDAGRIQHIYIISNPDKLSHIRFLS